MIRTILIISMLCLALLAILYPRLTRRANVQRRQVLRFFWTACAVIFVLSMIAQPKVVYEGAIIGLKAWWNIVFPTLLPFFIASELLMSFGVVHFMGVLLEPVMRPVFNVPGTGSFVMAIGFTSGYPIGAMVTARLRSDRLCTRVEAERLMSFTNNSSPLFMLAAVSVGMFGRPDLGVIIAGAHYLANLTLGLVLRFYGRKDREILPFKENHNENIFKRAFGELTGAWRRETRPLGKIMGDAVRNAINNLLNIGGFIILFAVIIKLLTIAGFINLLAGLLGAILLPLGFSPEIMPALASGFFEMTIGSKLASDAAAPLLQQVTAVGMILAWSGLSVQAQVASMISETDIRMLPFVCVRLAHAALAAVYTAILFGPVQPLALDLGRPVMATLSKAYETPAILANLQFTGLMLIITIMILLLFSALYIFIKKIKFYLLRI